ncbi:MAG TPA: hypothetical protein DCS05_05190 [Nitrospiraceae bacterium]|nr:hypothetical protein [Nitrospiraceae bacterium]
MTPMEKVAQALKARAMTGYFSGVIHQAGLQNYIARCTWMHTDGTVLLFTRDTGHHSAGWFKNPDYERCWHLSISFRDPETEAPRPFDRKEAERWTKLFFRGNTNLLWCEPPCYPEGKINGVHHYRLFCDEVWQPIKPRGEVYSREFTEKGWKSFSEIHGQEEQCNDNNTKK